MQVNENDVRGETQKVRHLRHVYQVQQKKPRTDEYQGPMVSFTEADLDMVQHPHNDALVVTLKIGKCHVRRILIDQDSSCDIMYVRCYKELGLHQDNLKQSDSLMVRFNGTLTWPLEATNLEVPWLHAMKVVLSTLHQLLRFPTEQGIEVVKGDQVQVKNCSMAVMKSTCNVREAETVEIEDDDREVLDDIGKEIADKSEEALKKILVQESDEERFFLLGSSLAEEKEKELETFLRANIEVFAWTPYEMLNRSLVRVAKMRSYGRVKIYRIHDLWREIIVLKSEEQNIVTIGGEQSKEWPNLSILASSNDGLRLLTVLELKGASLETFPNEVLKLLHLRYLSLRGTKVKIIPKSIGKLQNLETLDLKQTHVTELPDDILKLQRLRHILLYRYIQDPVPTIRFKNHCGFKAPMEIGNLSSLQKLCSIETNHDNGTILLGEIGKLTQLRKLQIESLRNEDGRVLCSSLEKLSNLRSLIVRATGDDKIIDLDSLSSPPPLLRTLRLEGSLRKVPHWIPSLHSLVRVILRWSKLRDVDPLESLQGLPNLVELRLFQTYEGAELCFKAGGFQRLVRLYLRRFKGLRWVKVEAGSMPYLEQLFIRQCGLVEELPSGIEHLTSLKSLQLVDMSDGLISSLNRDLEGGNYWKIANIPAVWIGDTKRGYFEGNYL
ncbi:unnamed protein product [Camellia sinensis]